jgi:hypothetical protein
MPPKAMASDSSQNSNFFWWPKSDRKLNDILLSSSSIHA